MIPAYPSLNITRDSLEHKLLNLTWCWVNAGSSVIDISFMADADIKKHEALPYEALRRIDSQLPALLEDLFERFDPASQEFLDMIKATFAHMFSSYVTLPGTQQTTQYPYLSHITSIRGTSDANTFSVAGYNFFIGAPGKSGLPHAILNPSDVLYLSRKTIEHVWPGSANRVLAMESIGYSDEQIVESVLTGLPELQPTSTITDIIFE